MNYLKLLVKKPLVSYAIFSFALISCASPREEAAQQHALVVEKWKALASYAKIEKIEYPFKIAAELTVQSGEEKEALRFAKIHLTDNINQRSINLLAPSFQKKLICDIGCKQLTEYISFRNTTLLKEYFNFYEFDLFKLYAELFLLTESVHQLQNAYPDAFPAYLAWLSTRSESITTLDEFTAFLKHAFSIEGFKEYANNPETQYAHLFQELISDGIETSEVDESFWDLSNDTPESEMWDSGENEQSWMFEGSNIARDKFQQMQQSSIDVGDTVCTFASNIFGIVSGFKGRAVSLKILGRLKTYIDGQISNAPSGAFFGNVGERVYVPQQGNEIFELSQVAQCTPKI